MSNIAKQLKAIQETLPNDVRLVAVSKYHTQAELMEAYHAGQRCFGESRVQELLPKVEASPKDIEWHFIGHLQRNKVKYIVPFIHTIQSVDSEDLLKTINKYAAKSKERSKPINILLQVHVAQEDTKSGFSSDELNELMASKPWERYQEIRFAGLMMMASNTDDSSRIIADFEAVKQLFDRYHSEASDLSLPDTFQTLSMGMSHDYQLAIAHGSNMIRVGSKIFSN